MSYIGLNQPQAVVDPNSIAPEAYAGRNLLINGDFGVNQRGTTGTGVVGYPATDRWYTPQTNQILTAFNSASSLSGYNLRVERDGSTDGRTVRQAIELPRDGYAGVFQQGEVFTLSGRFYSNKAGTLTVSFNFADDAGLTNSVVIHSEGITYSDVGNWHELDMTFTVGASPAGTNKAVVLNLNFGSGEDDTAVYYQSLQLEQGSQATEFETIDPATQLAKCQRYYEMLQQNITGINASTSRVQWSFKVTKRSVPIVVFAGGSAGNVYQNGLDGVGSNATSEAAIIASGSSADAEL